MCSVRLVLGMERLGEVDDGALPPLQTLCRALDMRTHWSASEATLYIESPATGRNVAVLAEPSNVAAYTRSVDQIVAMLTERLSQAGAHVCHNPHEAHLVLRVAVGAHTSSGVSATYPWSTRQSLRTLADLITAEVAREASLADLGAKASLLGGRSLPVPWLQVGIGRPDRVNGVRLQDPAFCQNVAAGMFSGLCRHWAGPVLAEVSRYLPDSQPRFVASQPEPERPSPPEPERPSPPEPKLVLEPAPEPEPQPVLLLSAQPDADRDQEPRLVLAPALATVTELPRPAPPAPPAKPKPAQPTAQPPAQQRRPRTPLLPPGLPLPPLPDAFTRTPPPPLPPPLPPVVPQQPAAPPPQRPVPAHNHSVFHIFQWVGRPAQRVRRGSATISSFQQRPKK